MIPILQAQKVLVPVCLELQQIQSQEMCEFCKKAVGLVSTNYQTTHQTFKSKVNFLASQKKRNHCYLEVVEQNLCDRIQRGYFVFPVVLLIDC